MRKILFLLLVLVSLVQTSIAQKDSVVTKKDRKRDVLLQTSLGDIVIRLSDSTPLHRDNFLKLVKTHFYDSIIFHRVIQHFMIQAGDPTSKNVPAGQYTGGGAVPYKIPAEFRQTLFHKKGVIAAARNNNPEKASSGSQFYLTKGKIFTEAGLDSLEKSGRLEGRTIPLAHREVYKTIGGVPHLDNNYTVFGEVVRGVEIIDKIAAVETGKAADLDRPLQDVRIIKAVLIKRKKK